MALITLGANAITALPSGVGGKVLQVVTGTTTTRVQNDTDDYADTTLTVNITPASTSNKVLIIGTQADIFKSSSNADSSIHIRLLRDTTEILDIADRTTFTGSTTENLGSASFHCLDSPSSTSELTYKTQFHNQGDYAYVAVQQQSIGKSTIIAMEIKG